jgi:uncharacterized membrane protein
MVTVNTGRVLWIVQIMLGIYFVLVGIIHFILPEVLPGPMGWMYDLSDGLHVISGAAEILGGLGLILPGLTRIQPGLTVWAAVGLVIVMIGAAVWHIGRGEPGNMIQNFILAAVLGYVAYGRWRVSPLPGSFGAAPA